VIPSNFLTSSLDQLIIEVFFPSVDFNEFDIVENFVGDFHAVVSRNCNLFLEARSIPGNGHVDDGSKDKDSHTCEERRSDQHCHEDDGKDKDITDENDSVEVLGEKGQTEAIDLHQTGDLSHFELLVAKRGVTERFIDHAKCYTV
jgi:hypothetical protein